MARTRPLSYDLVFKVEFETIIRGHHVYMKKSGLQSSEKSWNAGKATEKKQKEHYGNAKLTLKETPNWAMMNIKLHC